MQPAEITAEGLVLRPWRPEDADALYRACQDANIRRLTAIPTPYERGHADAFVGGAQPEWAVSLAVCAADSGDLLGSCGLIGIDHRRKQAEVGYWTAPWATGRGVASAATRAVSRWAFEQGLSRLNARVRVGNHASLQVLRRCGFTVEGIARGGTVDGWDAWFAGLRAGEDDAPALPSYVSQRARVFGRPQPVLFASTKDGEIRLRPLEERDADGVVAGARDPESVRWTTVPHPYEPEHAEFFILDYGPAVWARGTGAVFGIGDPIEDAYSGVMELRLWPHDPASADVGFVVAPHARGRGFAPAALTAVAVWGFTTLGLQRIEWRANVGNTASRRVAEKAGFTFEGTARGALDHRGERTDAWVAALLASDIGKGDT